MLSAIPMVKVPLDVVSVKVAAEVKDKSSQFEQDVTKCVDQLFGEIFAGKSKAFIRAVLYEAMNKSHHKQ
mgnify:CR=1 FL=1